MNATATLHRPIEAWTPTPAEVAAIVLEMRPIIDRCVERESQRLS